MDYWDFTAIQEAFFNTFPGTRRVCSRGGVYRLRGSTLTMISPSRNWSFNHLDEEFQFKKFRSFLRSDVPEYVPRNRNGKTWYVDQGFVPSSSANQEVRRGLKEGVTFQIPTQAELHHLLVTWKAWAQSRHFMVVTGHYKSMIAHPGMLWHGVYLNSHLVGAIGYTLQNELACIGYCKSVPGHWWLGKCLWITALDRILAQGPSRVICGDTADKIKEAMGFSPMPAYRLQPRELP